ncbi:MAG TPA: carbohydrate binding family 9 domain-containing protein, partial [Thermoanaerobaculia bacterium]|nr:carbohydrate binding family 9 domain-containing protein [Thermoanaerobaculia bacterium]
MSMKKAGMVAGLALCALAPLAGAQETAGKPPLKVERAASKITLDGILDEAAWGSAGKMELQFETRPAENTAPPVRTEVLFTYDEDHIYVAFRSHDPNPSEIRAHLSDRDTAFSDDFVGIVLDPFNDERRAFEFFVNPLGVQMDLFMDDVGGNEDSSWDAIWDAAGKIHPGGYDVEIAIPWSSLRFPRTEGDQTWGFDALRFYPRNQRHRIASQPMDRNVNFYLCQISKLTGFSGVTPGRNLEV